ncbi:VCBS repeat-containing protein [Xylophilus sp. GOD-11R]|uniref:FG-GAP repeat domain-containing protein n=1 Tax=Xylophilus sp. GOD-11R TaxID=3089814 RepID=UPI00298C9ACE|nr:VCBS repeat-containing protein [Xylophilus sp. GOD-11R]WPB58537.1 VCBS repeat-containing protein [Xylophilus sp. GOD-11R]
MNKISLLALISSAFMAACGGGGSDSASNAGSNNNSGAGQTQPINVVFPAVPAGTSVQPTSYLNAKNFNLAPVRLPGNSWSDATVLADFKQNGTFQLFTARLNYDPRSSTPTSAAASTFGIYSRDPVAGNWILETGMLDTSAGCIHPRKAAVADLNKDSIPDIVVGCHGYDATPFPGERMYAVLSQGGGRFRVAPIPAGIGFFHNVTVADINQDGNADIVATDNVIASNAIRVFLGAGDGSFTEHAELAPQVGRNRPIYTIELVDLNNDGRPDLIMGGADNQGWPVTTTLNQGGSRVFNGGASTVYGANSAWGIATDFVADGPYLYVARTTDNYSGASIEQIDLTTKASSNLKSSTAVPWTALIVKYGGTIQSAMVGRGL